MMRSTREDTRGFESVGGDDGGALPHTKARTAAGGAEQAHDR
jgi:hypothetical protein